MDCYRELTSATIVNYKGKEWLNVSFHSEPTNEIQRPYDSVKPNARFLGVNILEELDAESEYFISEAERRLYFLPPPRRREPPP